MEKTKEKTEMPSKKKTTSRLEFKFRTDLHNSQRVGSFIIGRPSCCNGRFLL